MRKVATMFILLLLSGCAGLGFNKQATLMPDAVGVYYEAAPTGSQRDWRDAKIGVRSDWKFAAPTLKEKK